MAQTAGSNEFTTQNVHIMYKAKILLTPCIAFYLYIAVFTSWNINKDIDNWMLSLILCKVAVKIKLSATQGDIWNVHR